MQRLLQDLESAAELACLCRVAYSSNETVKP